MNTNEYRDMDSLRDISKKVLRILEENFVVSPKNRYAEMDSIRDIWKKILRIFNDGATFGGGGSSSDSSGDGPPSGDPGVETAFYYDRTNKVIYAWNDDLGVWE